MLLGWKPLVITMVLSGAQMGDRDTSTVCVHAYHGFWCLTDGDPAWILPASQLEMYERCFENPDVPGPSFLQGRSRKAPGSHVARSTVQHPSCIDSLRWRTGAFTRSHARSVIPPSLPIRTNIPDVPGRTSAGHAAKHTPAWLRGLTSRVSPAVQYWRI